MNKRLKFRVDLEIQLMRNIREYTVKQDSCLLVDSPLH